MCRNTEIPVITEIPRNPQKSSEIPLNIDYLSNNELSKIGITAAELTARCKDAGLWISALGPHYARLVTHLDFDDAQCDVAIEILKRALVVK